MSTREDLKTAIDQKNIIIFQYDGHCRIAEPYHLGKIIRTPKSHPIIPPRDNHMLCYQIKGTSKKGKMGYKVMDIGKIENLKINETQNFIIRDDYNSSDRKWEIEYGVEG
jgi:hypothetical protein